MGFLIRLSPGHPPYPAALALLAWSSRHPLPWPLRRTSRPPSCPWLRLNSPEPSGAKTLISMKQKEPNRIQMDPCSFNLSRTVFLSSFWASYISSHPRKKQKPWTIKELCTVSCGQPHLVSCLAGCQLVGLFLEKQQLQIFLHQVQVQIWLLTKRTTKTLYFATKKKCTSKF